MNELLKYYKYIRTCKLCKLIYGLDSDTEDKLKDVCPNCRSKLRKKVYMRFKEILVNTGIPLRQIRKQPIDTLARLYPKQIEELIRLTTKECLVCGKKFNSNHNKQSTCSYNCSLINEIRYRKKYSKKNRARIKKRYIDMKKLAKIVTKE